MTGKSSETFQAWCVGALAILMLIGGCGAGGAGGAIPSGSSSRGRIVLVFPNPRFPDGLKSAYATGSLEEGRREILRVIPETTAYFMVKLVSSSGLVVVNPMRIDIVPGQAQATATISDIEAGSYMIYIAAYDSSAALLGTGSSQVAVVAGASTTAQVTITSGSGKKVYVTNSSDGTVSVIDSATDTVVGLIALPSGTGGTSGPLGVDFTADGAYAAVADYTNNVVHLISTASGSVVASVTGVTQPSEVTLRQSPANDGRGIVSNGSNTVYVLDTFNRAIPTSLTVSTAQNVFYTALSPDGVYLYPGGNSVVTGALDHVARYRRSDFQAMDARTFGSANERGVWSVAHPSNGRLYVVADTSGAADYVAVFNATDLNLGLVSPFSMDVGSNPTCVAVTPDGSQLYVTNKDGDDVTVINVAGWTASTVDAASYPFINPVRVAAHPDGSKVYVTNISSGKVSVVDTAANKVVKTIDVGSAPSGISVQP